jgi:Flp pilus assembly protein CpaB
MVRKQKSVILMVLLLLQCAISCARSYATENAEGPMVKVVYALKSMTPGQTIGRGDLAEKLVTKSEIPDGILSRELTDTKGTPDERGCHPYCYFESSKEQVVGRISLGISAGEICFFTHPGGPGYRGTSVVCATENIPPGRPIEPSQLIELDVHPSKIPMGAIWSKADSKGEFSTGIAVGQVVVYGRGRHRLGGAAIGSLPKKRVLVSATKRIRKGEILRADELVESMTWDLNVPSEMVRSISAASGRKTRYGLESGQILTEENLTPRRPPRSVQNPDEK